MGEIRGGSDWGEEVAFSNPATLERCGAPADLVLGYAEPWVVHPGDTVGIHVGGAGSSADASVVELTGIDPDGAACFVELADLGSIEVDPQRPWMAGSHVDVGPADVIAQLSTFSASLWIRPTLATSRPQTILSTLDDSGGWELALSPSGGLLFGTPSGTIDSGIELAIDVWTEVTLACDATSVRFTARSDRAGEREARADLPTPVAGGAHVLRIAAPHREDRPVSDAGNGCFNGKLTGPSIRAGDAIVCELEFSDAISAHEFRDRSRHSHPAVVVNSPTAGVTGPTWRAHVSAFIQDEAQYSALHFHDDDLDDARWPVGAAFEIPADAPSGMYAARLRGVDSEDLVPFFVTNPRVARAEIVLLLPTLTYLAYADEHEILSNPPSYTAFTGLDSSEAPLGWRDWLVVESGLLSLYDVHRDGSTVPYASTRRPLLNLRPDYMWPLLNGPHGPGMDLRLIQMLRGCGHRFDVLTDHDLDAAGLDAISPYRVLVTGGHPEYWTAPMLDALDAYMGDGGRVAYLGGNGLHGVTGIDPDRRHVAEVRRSMFGSRPSSSAPGELWMTTTREEGGTWRARGRSSHCFVGVGTTSMGAGPGRPYTRSAASREPEFDWVFDGVQGDEVGADGGMLGGAAAYEFDRADAELGTDANACVLATASGFERLYYPLLEDFVGSNPEVADPGSDLVRADMVITIGEHGGGSFAAGSAAWCGSLGDGETLTDVGRVTDNVIRRFAETPRGEDPLRRNAAGP